MSALHRIHPRLEPTAVMGLRHVRPRHGTIAPRSGLHAVRRPLRSTARGGVTRLAMGRSRGDAGEPSWGTAAHALTARLVGKICAGATCAPERTCQFAALALSAFDEQSGSPALAGKRGGEEGGSAGAPMWPDRLCRPRRNGRRAEEALRGAGRSGGRKDASCLHGDARSATKLRSRTRSRTRDHPPNAPAPARGGVAGGDLFSTDQRVHEMLDRQVRGT
jgi:hypothetical protein